MPSNWSQLVENSRTKSVDGFYDVTKTWFEGQADPADTDPHSILPQADDKMPEANSDPDITNSHLMSENAISTQPNNDVLPAININTSAEGFPQLEFEDDINTPSDVGTQSNINVQPSLEESSQDIAEGVKKIFSTRLCRI